MAYWYSLVRFVPNPGRGEFVNVAALAGDDETGDRALRVISNFQRARSIDVDAAFPGALAFVGELDRWLLDEDANTSRLDYEGVAELAHSMHNIIQVTDPAPVRAESAEEALDVVFDRLVVDPARRSYRFLKKTSAQAAARRAYRESRLDDEALIERAEIDANGFPLAFDFAVHNGRAVQLAHCWSFQLPDQSELRQQVRAWAWGVGEVRNHGAVLHAGSDRLAEPSELEIVAVGIPPSSDQTDSQAYEEAQLAFREVNVELVLPDDMTVVSERAARMLSPA